MYNKAAQLCFSQSPLVNTASFATNALHVVVCSGIIGRSRKDFKKYLFNFIAAMPLVSVISLKIFT